MLERKKTQYRIRIFNPNLFNPSTFRIKDVGSKGGLQLVIARPKGKRTTTIQSIRVSVKDFRRKGNKIYPVSSRGLRELAVLKRRKTGKLAQHVKKYFGMVK